MILQFSFYYKLNLFIKQNEEIQVEEESQIDTAINTEGGLQINIQATTPNQYIKFYDLKYKVKKDKMDLAITR